MKSLALLTLTTLLMVGCTQEPQTLSNGTHATSLLILEDEPTVTQTPPIAQQPRRRFIPKKVDDSNYNSDYAYPDNPTKKSKPTLAVASKTMQYGEKNSTQPAPTTMSKEACIEMIGEAKFAKYTQMLGSEGSAIKRCVMLKAMRQR